MKKALLILGILGVAVAVFFCLYFPTLTRYRELRSEQDSIEQKITELDRKIQALEEEKELLQSDSAYVEKVIREELGLVKPGEVVYKFIKEKAKTVSDLEDETEAVENPSLASAEKSLTSAL